MRTRFKMLALTLMALGLICSTSGNALAAGADFPPPCLTAGEKNGGVTLNWFAPTNLNVPIAKYKVTLRNLASGSQRTFMVSGTPTWWNEIWFSHAGAPTGNTTYRYTVQTGIYDANGALVFSGPSNVVDVSPRIPISPPCLSASNSGRGVYLNWTSPIKGTASEYIVTRTRVGPGDGSASDGTVRFVVNGSRVTYYDQAVLPTYKDPYMYSIQAKDASGNLSASSPVVYAY